MAVAPAPQQPHKHLHAQQRTHEHYSHDEADCPEHRRRRARDDDDKLPQLWGAGDDAQGLGCPQRAQRREVSAADALRREARDEIDHGREHDCEVEHVGGAAEVGSRRCAEPVGHDHDGALGEEEDVEECLEHDHGLSLGRILVTNRCLALEGVDEHEQHDVADNNSGHKHGP